MSERVPNVILYMLMVVMLISGMANTIFLKLQNYQKYYNEEMDKEMEFNHPFFQTY